MLAGRRLSLTGLGLILALGFGWPVAAQDGASWMRVDTVQVRPDKLDDFVELYQEVINPALRRAGVPWRSAWETGEFGETYQRLFVTPMASFTELDRGGPLARSLEPRQLSRVRSRLREYTDSRQSHAVLYREDLSVESEDVTGLPIARVTNLQIAPGRAAEFEAFLRSSLENFRSAGVVFGVYHRQFGPGPVIWQVVENLRSYGELSRGGIIRAFGNDGSANVLAGLTGVVTAVERTILAYDVSLSYRGADLSTVP